MHAAIVARFYGAINSVRSSLRLGSGLAFQHFGAGMRQCKT
jgi:hypothetical protein